MPSNGETALVLAAENGHASVVRILVDAGRHSTWYKSLLILALDSTTTTMMAAKQSVLHCQQIQCCASSVEIARSMCRTRALMIFVQLIKAIQGVSLTGCCACLLRFSVPLA